MTAHWAHVTAAYALAALGFGGLALGAWLRHRAARRRLEALDPRSERGLDSRSAQGLDPRAREPGSRTAGGGEPTPAPRRGAAA